MALLQKGAQNAPNVLLEPDFIGNRPRQPQIPSRQRAEASQHEREKSGHSHGAAHAYPKTEGKWTEHVPHFTGGLGATEKHGIGFFVNGNSEIDDGVTQGGVGEHTCSNIGCLQHNFTLKKQLALRLPRLTPLCTLPKHPL